MFYRLFVLFILLIMLLGSVAFAQTFAIKAGHLIDPENGEVEDNQIILVENKIIKEIGSSVTIPADATVIDLSGDAPEVLRMGAGDTSWIEE